MTTMFPVEPHHSFPQLHHKYEYCVRLQHDNHHSACDVHGHCPTLTMCNSVSFSLPHIVRSPPHTNCCLSKHKQFIEAIADGSTEQNESVTIYNNNWSMRSFYSSPWRNSRKTIANRIDFRAVLCVVVRHPCVLLTVQSNEICNKWMAISFVSI